MELRKREISSIKEERFDKFEFTDTFEEEKEDFDLVSPEIEKPAIARPTGAYEIGETTPGSGIKLNPKIARRAIVLSEILRPPLALRRPPTR